MDQPKPNLSFMWSESDVFEEHRFINFAGRNSAANVWLVRHGRGGSDFAPSFDRYAGKDTGYAGGDTRFADRSTG